MQRNLGDNQREDGTWRGEPHNTLHLCNYVGVNGPVVTLDCSHNLIILSLDVGLIEFESQDGVVVRELD